jgi:hypothetical protein
MAQTAAHLVEQVMPWVPTRQWVVSVPVPLRDWMATSQDLTATVHTIIRTTIGKYYVNQAVTRGVPRDKVQPGVVLQKWRWPLLYCPSKGISVHKQANDKVVHLRGFREADGLTHQAFDPRP